MIQKNLTKRLAVILVFALMISVFGSHSAMIASGKKSSKQYREAYINFVKQQQKKSKGGQLSYAIINASKNKKPVLLIAKVSDGINSDYEKGVIQANVYSYHKGKVVYITKMQSTGSGYPLMTKGKYIISGWHHSSQRLMVSGEEGRLESVEGFGMEDAECYKKSWTEVEGRQKTGVTSKKISEKRAMSMDYYSNACEKGGKTIKFSILTSNS